MLFQLEPIVHDGFCEKDGGSLIQQWMSAARFATEKQDCDLLASLPLSKPRHLIVKQIPNLQLAKATAKHVVSIAQTFAGDDSSKALQTMARCCKNDAEKALQKVLREFDLTLDVPITQMACAVGVNIPVLLPQDFIKTLSGKGFLHKLLGGPVRNRTFDSK